VFICVNLWFHKESQIGGVMAKEKHKDKVIAKASTKEEINLAAQEIRAGSNVKISHKLYEGDKERVQTFQGIVIKIRGGEDDKTITVRKMSRGIGVERIFPLSSPILTKIEVKNQSKVRRAKLYYLRTKKGQEAKLKEKKVKV